MKEHQEHLFVYKYQPTSLHNINRPQTRIFQKIIDKNTTPNIILYGQENSGKHTLLYAFLKDKYGPFNTQCTYHEFKINAKKLSVPVYHSPYHVEIDVNGMFSHVRSILPPIIKEYAQTKNVLTSKHKLFVIHHMENLEEQTQHMLRRILELNMENCRFIFITTKLNKITLPLQSRCYTINIPQFTRHQSLDILHNINNQLDTPVATNILSGIIDATHPNIKESIFKLEASYYNIEIDDISYKKNIRTVIDCIANNTHDYKKLYEYIDNFLYQCLYKNIPLENIILLTFQVLREKLNTQQLNQILKEIVYYDKNMNNGFRDFIHIQAFYYYIVHFFNQ